MPDVKERFLNITKDHELSILLDQGLYKHLRLMNPKSSPYWFDITTWPNYLRALSIKMYKQQGKDAQKIAGHASEQMTKNYAKGHDEIIWSEAIPDLDVSNLL